MVHVSPRLMLFFSFLALGLYLLSQHYDPKRPAERILQRMVCGLGTLAGWTLMTGLSAAVNPLSALICGWLGIPGALLTTLLGML